MQLLAVTIASLVVATLADGNYGLSDYGLTVTFYDPANTDTCGQGDVGNSSAIQIQVESPPAVSSCLDLNETFMEPNVTYRTPGYTCLGSEDSCGLSYQLTGASNYNASANYSMVYYYQQMRNTSEDDTAGWITFQTYEGTGCQQGSESDDETLYPWIRWNCLSMGDCSTLPYGVRSISILSSEDAGFEVGDGKCEIDAQQGGSGRFEKDNAGVSISPRAVWSISIAACLGIAWLL